MITVKKIEILAASLGALFAAGFWVFLGKKTAIGCVVGSAVSIASLHLSYVILKKMLTRLRKKSIWKIVAFVGVKIGVLFVAIPLLILKLGIEPIGFVVGFSVVVVSITALGFMGIREAKDAP